jgi:ribonuclease BN (tRNA processing enzyme)
VTIEKRSPIKIPQDKSHFFNVEAFPVLHSTRAPAVGYRIKAGNAKIFYVPDVVYIKDREDAMKGVDYYIGDGSTVKRSLVRKPGDTIVGHVPIQTQLTWCQKTGVSKAIFTHIGSQIVQGNEKEINQQIQAMAKERKLDEVIIAFDGMEITVR